MGCNKLLNNTNISVEGPLLFDKTKLVVFYKVEKYANGTLKKIKNLELLMDSSMRGFLFITID